MALSPPAPRPPGVWLRAGRRHSTQGPWQGRAAVAPCRPPPPHRRHLLLPPPARNFTALRAAARRRTPARPPALPRRHLEKGCEAGRRSELAFGRHLEKVAFSLLGAPFPSPLPPPLCRFFFRTSACRERHGGVIAEENLPQEGSSALSLHSSFPGCLSVAPLRAEGHLLMGQLAVPFGEHVFPQLPHCLRLLSHSAVSNKSYPGTLALLALRLLLSPQPSKIHAFLKKRS